MLAVTTALIVVGCSGGQRPPWELPAETPDERARRRGVEVSLADAEIGTCFRLPDLLDDDPPRTVPSVPCREDHHYELYARVELDGSPYPGAAAAQELADAACKAEFEGYVGTAYEESVYYSEPVVPVRQAWDAGDRVVHCLIYKPVEGFEPNEWRGSARGSAE